MKYYQKQIKKFNFITEVINMSQFVTPHYIFTGENALDDAKNVIGTFGKKALENFPWVW